MSNKEWDKISYNESYWAEMDKIVKKWEDLTKERPIEDAVYHQIVHDDAAVKKNANDVY